MARANQTDRSPESTELNEAVLSVLAHELGGIASALDLRAEAMSSTIPPGDKAALRSLAEEVRASTRALRLIRSADTSGTLGPSRELKLSEWWRLASKLSRVVLPRGTIIAATFDDSQLTALNAAALTWLWLSACKALDEKWTGAGTVTLRGHGSNSGQVVLRAVVQADVSLQLDSESRWARHATRIASGIGAEAPVWEHSADGVVWTCAVPAARK